MVLKLKNNWTPKSACCPVLVQSLLWCLDQFSTKNVFLIKSRIEIHLHITLTVLQLLLSRNIKVYAHIGESRHCCLPQKPIFMSLKHTPHWIQPVRLNFTVQYAESYCTPRMHPPQHWHKTTLACIGFFSTLYYPISEHCKQYQFRPYFDTHNTPHGPVFRPRIIS